MYVLVYAELNTAACYCIAPLQAARKSEPTQSKPRAATTSAAGTIAKASDSIGDAASSRQASARSAAATTSSGGGSGGDGSGGGSPYVASMQFMITRAMKKTLINSLHYTPEEVEDMEPQIAAVVVSHAAESVISQRRQLR